MQVCMGGVTDRVEEDCDTLDRFDTVLYGLYARQQKQKGPACTVQAAVQLPRLCAADY